MSRYRRWPLWSARLALVRAGGRGPVGHHRALRPARHRPGARHLRRRAGLRGGRDPAGAGELRRDLAQRLAGPRPRSRRACCSALALLAYPAYLGLRASKLPEINDITTDFANPPRFDVLARLRPRGRIDYPARFAELQRKAYPDVVPLQVELPVRAAYDTALQGDRQAQVAGGRCAAAGRRAARRRHRGGGAHTDHGLPRRRRGAGDAAARRLARRRALGLALRPPRFRHQRAARRRAARRHRRRREQCAGLGPRRAADAEGRSRKRQPAKR